MMLDDSSPETDSPARRIVLMIAGIALIAGSFAFTVPRRAEIAASMAPQMVLEVPAEMPDMGDAEPAAETEADGAAGTPAPAGEDAGGAPITAPAAPDQGAPAENARTAAAEPKPEPARMQVLTRPIAIDTATFLVGRARVRLVGVEPVPVGQRCDAAFGGTWPCGATARTALRAWLRARSITCDVPEDFAKSAFSTESRCALGERDIGAWLVESGWARAAAGGPYAAAEAKAREAKAGIWGGG